MKKLFTLFSIALVATAFLNVAHASPGNDGALTSKTEKYDVTSNFDFNSEPVSFYNYEMVADGVFVITSDSVCFGDKTISGVVASAEKTTINDVFETGIGIRPEKNSYNDSLVSIHAKIYPDNRMQSWCGNVYLKNKCYKTPITNRLV
jgi:hypothetical protein